jgi:hypothetical protein
MELDERVTVIPYDARWPVWFGREGASRALQEKHKILNNPRDSRMIDFFRPCKFS